MKIEVEIEGTTCVECHRYFVPKPQVTFQLSNEKGNFLQLKVKCPHCNQTFVFDTRE